MGVGGQRHAPAALPPEKTRYPLCRRLGGPLGPVWTGAENLAPTGIRFPDRPARSESLYRLSYTGPSHSHIAILNRNKTQMKFLRHLLGITKLDKEINHCIRGKKRSREYSKGNKTVPGKVATTHTEDGHKQDT